MKSITCLSVFALVILLAGCATPPEQVAQTECKLSPTFTDNAVNPKRQPTSLEQHYAENKLQSTGFYQRQYNRYGNLSNLDEAVRDCRAHGDGG
jgi:hypothetical protein